MTLTSTLVDKIIHVATLLQVQYHHYVIYSNSSTNDGIRNVYDLYYNKPVQAVAVNL
jgi:hypothetical protein